MKTNKGKTLKTYNLKILSSKEETVFNQFKKVGIYHGQNTRDLVLKLMEEYILLNGLVAPKLVTESELLEELSKKGLNTNKALLIKHRTQGNLNNMWWSNPDGRVVYDKLPVLKFFKGRQGKGSGSWLNRSKNENK